MSPHAIFKADKSKYAPNFTGITISSPTQYFQSVSFTAGKKATLLAIFSTQMAYRMCKPYLETVESMFPSDPDVGVIRVQFEENWMKWAIIKYFLRSSTLRPQYTPVQQVSLLICTADVGGIVYSDKEVCESGRGGGDAYYEYASGVYSVIG